MLALSSYAAHLFFNVMYTLEDGESICFIDLLNNLIKPENVFIKGRRNASNTPWRAGELGDWFNWKKASNLK